MVHPTAEVKASCRERCQDPADASASANPPVGHTHTDYDQGIAGMAAAYWPNTTLTGAPKVHAGAPDPSGALVANWGSGGPPGPGPERLLVGPLHR